MVEQAKLIHRSHGQRFESATAYIIKTILYICSMKKEFGKWLMDIAKYMATALLLSSAFGDMENPLVVISVIIATASTLVFGLVLVKDKKEEKEI